MDKPITAYAGENSTVIYEYADGRKEQWTGGFRTWRNNNPGNVIVNGIEWEGKIGDAGGFCIFNDPEKGRRATRKIISNRQREGKTLEQAIVSYAPSTENNTEAYIKDVSKRSKIDRNTILLKLSSAQMDDIVIAMFIHEGWAVGKIVVLQPAGVLKTGKYIWHTAHDAKVRKDHIERDGKVFDFANPPPGGNPGDAYNCRCTAEPIPDQSLKEIFRK